MGQIRGYAKHCLFSFLFVSSAYAQTSTGQQYDSLAVKIFQTSLRSGKAYGILTELTTTIGNRLSGSANAAKAAQWAKQQMEECGLENVHLEPCKVPHWVRGEVEEGALLLSDGQKIPLAITALGGSVATPTQGITAGVLEVHSFAELRKMGEAAKGKIVFFNRPFDKTKFNTFEAYGGAVDQRWAGSMETARAGGVMALVRSVTSHLDNAPHAGVMGYADSLPKVPGVSISTIGANQLSEWLEKDKNLKVHIRTSCQTLPDVESANVVGEIRGSETPNEVIVVGGHLDSWDKGQGAHDDGSGVVQSIEALRLLKQLGLKPRRTIRAVAFMNEENGGRGGEAYAAKERPGEKHIAAIESDMGGFMPRGFGVSTDSVRFQKIARWQHIFSPIWADRIVPGGGGTDISYLASKGVPEIALIPESQRYFDYHHSDNDTIDKVNERELELGAACLAILTYVLAQEGL
ncbi:MAG TPA: M20/M25/M40 family metallo-hydrolase [Bacteroidota bacterium]